MSVKVLRVTETIRPKEVELSNEIDMSHLYKPLP